VSTFEYDPDMDISIQKAMHEELESIAALFSSFNMEKVRATFVVVMYDDDRNVHTRHCIAIEDEGDRYNAILGLFEAIKIVVKKEID